MQTTPITPRLTLAARTTVLLTGATGVLGSAVLTELTARGAEVIALTRRRSPAGDCGTVAGDVGAPLMGLAADRYEALAEQVDVVLHCAALTAFTTDAAKARAVNTDGTQHVVAFAAAAGAQLVHVSTAFVDRAHAYSDAEHLVRGPAAYLQAKVAAERVVTDSGLPALMVRPSILIGDSRTGTIPTYQGLHVLCAAVMAGQVPFLPGSADDLVDAVPLDTTAAAVAVAALGRHGATSPAELWLTAGPQALRLGELVQHCRDLGTDLGMRPVETALLPRERVTRLIYPAFAAAVPAAMRQQMEEAMQLTHLFESPRPMPLTWQGPQRADLHDVLERVMRGWATEQQRPSRTGAVA